MIVTPQEVLDFWFVECEPADWFKKSEEFDHEIRTRFLETYEAIVAGETTEWRRSAKGAWQKLSCWINFLEICLGMMLRRLLQMHSQWSLLKRQCLIGMSFQFKNVALS